MDLSKRERQRMHVKNSYYRQQERMKTLRKEVAALEQQYADAVQRKQHQQFGAVLAGMARSEQQPDDLVEQYTQLSIKKEALHRENKQLADMAAQHEQFQLRLGSVLSAVDSPLPMVDVPSATTVQWPAVHELNHASFEPLSIQECHEIASEAYREICAFLQSNSYLTTGAVLYGWRDQRHLAPDHVKFTLKKHFPGTTPRELSAQAWRVTSSAQGLAGLYSPTMHLSLKRLQVVDENNVVMYRVIPNARSSATVQSLFLVSRFQVYGGYVILFRSVDHSRLRRLQQREVKEETVADKWLDMFTWYVPNDSYLLTLTKHLSFLRQDFFEADPYDDNAVVFSYGGVVYSTEAASTHVWMMEILLLALRWEAKVIGSTFMLRN